MSISIDLNKEETDAKISIRQNFTFDMHQDFRRAYEGLPDSCKKIELDLNDVEYIDSSGIGMIMLLVDIVKDKKSRLEITNVQGTVRETFELMNMDQITPVQYI